MCTKFWVRFMASHKSGSVVLTCNPSTREVKARGSEVQGHLLSHSEFIASLKYKRFCLLPSLSSPLKTRMEAPHKIYIRLLGNPEIPLGIHIKEPGIAFSCLLHLFTVDGMGTRYPSIDEQLRGRH